MVSRSLRAISAEQQPTHTKATIQIALKTPIGKDIVWIVVEDTDDINVYKPFLDNATTRILTSKSSDGRKGCHYVEQIVTDILNEQSTTNIFGIRDTDYTKYDSYQYPKGVFHTDYRDIEMMMFSTSSVIDHLTEWNGDFIQKYDEVISVTRIFGYMRICNYLYNLGCNFKKKIKISHVWDNSNHVLIENWKEQIQKDFINNCNKSFSLEEYNRTINEKNLNDESENDICQGHDVVRLLQYMFVENKYNESEIMRQMTISYNLSDFKLTSLYSDIDEWSKVNNKTVFIS
jgi:hypothetical protein